ncbi:MAG: hypothetical protein AB1846_05620 [Chloroflexota bacterium]
MSNTLRTVLIVVVVVVVGAGLFFGGMAYSRMIAWSAGYGPGWMMGGGYAPYQSDTGQQPYYGPAGMMGGAGYGGMLGSGMMGGFGSLYGVTPLSVDEARQSVESYLSSFGNSDLAIEEIMTFDNNAYAIVTEKSSGVGAFELLVDPVTRAVYPEYGPNMMWNLKYGMMSGFGGYGLMGPGMMMGGGFGPGGMMNGFGPDSNAQIPEVSADMSVSAEEAAQVAQQYLDAYYPGVAVSDEITAFYGYYTLDIEREGKIIGMLSVNGFTRQVFLHTWHGTFIEMSEE